MKKLLPVFFSILTVLFFLGCNNNYPPPIPVTDIALEPELSAKPISLVIGATHELNAKVKPDNATNKTLTYTSDNTAIASVNAKGVITAHSAGSAKITITAANGIAKEITVTVTIPKTHVTGIIFTPALSATPLPLSTGATYQLTAKAVPENATDKRLFFTSSSKDIASVSDTGLITAHSAGSAKITITAADGIAEEITVTVTTVEVPVTSIVIESAEDPLSLIKGAEHQLTAKALPDTATNKQLTYTSSNSNIVSVDAKGLVRAKETGKTQITITNNANNIKKEITVTVTAAQVPVDSIELAAVLLNKPLELVIGTNYELHPKVMPENATNKTLEITSSNNVIALPNGEGNRWIQANQEGTATITVKSVDNPEAKRELTVIVKKPPEIRIQNVSLSCGSSGENKAFTVQTLYGKLAYTLEITGGGSKWIREVKKESENDDTDIVRLTVTENKTIWERATSIKFKDINGKYLKDAHSQKDLEVNLTQAKNENPNVRIEWIHGITAPTSGEKKRISIAGSDATDYHKMSHIFMWEETPTTTFFNARKVTHTGAPDEGYLDGKQCWAKTNANMLHWWFTQNERYIEAYRAKNPERIAKKAKELEAVVSAFYKSTGVDKSELKLYEPFYRRELPNEEEHKKSSIANIYRRNFINHGNSIGIGLKWYLVGHSNFAKNKKYSPALFDDVFDRGNAFSEDDTALITTKGLATKKEFEEILKDALKSKKAVALNKWGTDRSQHAITLWGAAFDEDDNIIAVYVVDNNDHENKIFPYGIWYQKGIDIYAEPQLDQNDKARFNPYLIDYISNVYDSKHYIGEITTLATGEAQWEEWLNKNK